MLKAIFECPIPFLYLYVMSSPDPGCGRSAAVGRWVLQRSLRYYISRQFWGYLDSGLFQNKNFNIFQLRNTLYLTTIHFSLNKSLTEKPIFWKSLSSPVLLLWLHEKNHSRTKTSFSQKNSLRNKKSASWGHRHRPWRVPNVIFLLFTSHWSKCLVLRESQRRICPCWVDQR